jgi:hypothetical protein
VRKSIQEKKIFFYIKAPDNVKTAVIDGEMVVDLSDQILFDRHVAISCEKELSSWTGLESPRCIEGERASPPSCFWGVNDYSDFLDNRKRLSDRELIKGLKEYYGDRDAKPYIGLVRSGFDPAHFDIDKVNACLKKIIQR